VNIVGMSEQNRQRLGLGIGSPIASTTDTVLQDRNTRAFAHCPSPNREQAPARYAQ